MAPVFAKTVRIDVLEPPGDRGTFAGLKYTPMLLDDGDAVRLKLPENP